MIIAIIIYNLTKNEAQNKDNVNQIMEIKDYLQDLKKEDQNEELPKNNNL